MIRIACAATYAPERKYILEVMLRDFLGLDYRVQVEDRPDWRLCLDEDPGGSAVLIPDALFRVSADEWLTPAAMPRDPILRCSADQTAHDASQPENGLPVLYGAAPEACGIRLEGADVRLGVDIFGSAFFMLTRYEELVLDGSYEYGRFPASLSLAQRLGLLHRPVVNEYLELLWAALQLLWPRLERKPRQYRLWSTYDVDLPTAVAWHPRGAVCADAAADLFRRRDPALAWRRLRALSRTHRGDLNADPYWTFEQLLEGSESHGQASTFYFLPDESVYSMERPEIIGLLKQIRQRGHFVGVHPPLDSHQRPEAVLRAKKAVQHALELAGVSQEALGGRQQRLQWTCPDTWQAYSDAGLAHDSSLCFTDAAGFRCGTCYDFPVFNLRTRQQLALRERPLIAMETALANYKKLAPELVLKQVNELKAQCRKFRGDFVLSWHNSELWDNRQLVIYQQAIWP